VIDIKDEEYLKAFGMNFRKIWKEKGLSQIGRIERGEVNPAICTVKMIAEGFKYRT
jgi:predicted transcriptional regulator